MGGGVSALGAIALGCAGQGGRGSLLYRKRDSFESRPAYAVRCAMLIE